MDRIINKTKAWIQSFIIKLNLCPFASYALDHETIFFKAESSAHHEEQLISFWNTIQLLNEPNQYSSAILILPYGLEKFESYLDLYDKANWLLEDTQLNSNFQLASFHPQYLFENEDPHSLSHYTNRSPYPIIHILSVDEVAAAIKRHGNTSQIPFDNINTLNELGMAKIKQILNTNTHI